MAMLGDHRVIMVQNQAPDLGLSLGSVSRPPATLDLEMNLNLNLDLGHRPRLAQPLGRGFRSRIFPVNCALGRGVSYTSVVFSNHVQFKENEMIEEIDPAKHNLAAYNAETDRLAEQVRASRRGRAKARRRRPTIADFLSEQRDRFDFDQEV